MTKFKLIFLLILFTGCNTMSEAGKVLRNEKSITTDEFLVKKKKPLMLPPNYEDLPEPDSLENKKANEDDQLKTILKSSNIKKNIDKGTASIEDKILDRIKSD